MLGKIPLDTHPPEHMPQFNALDAIAMTKSDRKPTAWLNKDSNMIAWA
jgi:hypothetical protein